MMKLSNMTILDSLKHGNGETESHGSQITSKLVSHLDDIAKNGYDVSNGFKVNQLHAACNGTLETEHLMVPIPPRPNLASENSKREHYLIAGNNNF